LTSITEHHQATTIKFTMASVPSFPDIAPDEVDEPNTFLPSFADLRRKNLEALYGGGDDKSPKGYVDVAIQGLVDLINAHPSYVTLSSCSGRIAIFDPKESSGEDADQLDDGNDESTAGGKGRGEWILVSHEPIDPNSIPLLLTKEKKGTLIFKHEPLLLHVGAASVARGRKLLSIALGLGFRESGLVVTPARVTVAIRSHSLALTVPLAYSGALRPSDEYLLLLSEEANKRMGGNMEKLRRLESEIKTSIFQPISSDTSQIAGASPQQRIDANITKLPALNLWGHDAVTVPSQEGGAWVYVFGGYGTGPKGSSKKVCRSNHIYRLRHHSFGEMGKRWRVVDLMGLSLTQCEVASTNWFGVDVFLTDFRPTEGLKVCLLDLHEFAPPDTASRMIAVFGGRGGPSTPFGDLLLYESGADHLCKPIEIRGETPSPRWGHTLTALSGKGGLMAVLVGGRNDDGSLQDNVYILKLMEEGNKRFFCWNRVFAAANILPQFHHSVTCFDEDCFVLVGGLSDPNDLLECFSDSYRFVGTLGSYSRRKSVMKPSPISVFRVTGEGCEELQLPLQDSFVPHYGAGSCCLTDPNGKSVVAFIGGMALNGRRSMDLGSFKDTFLEPMRWCQFNSSISKYEVHYEPSEVGQVTFASMVHNCCVALPNTQEILQLGGGVSSFAFGASFAE
jgi:tRNA wybutosine-synthesizing protein 3